MRVSVFQTRDVTLKLDKERRVLSEGGGIEEI